MLQNSKLHIIVFFIAVSLTLILRSYVESTNYCTPDSKYYLEVATNIAEGNGPVGPKVFDFDKSKGYLIPLYDTTRFGNIGHYEPTYFAVWPLAYPLSIASVYKLTPLSILWASKVLNILLFGLDIYLILLIFGKNSQLSIFYFGSFTMLEILSYTWSENLFLTSLLLFFYGISIIIDEKSNKLFTGALVLFFALFLMCFTRYSSVIYFIVPGILAIYLFINKNFIKLYYIIVSVLLAAGFFAAYLFYNYLQCGYITGMPRVNTQEYTAIVLIQKLFMGLFHQLFIIKQFRFSGTIDFFYFLLLGLIQSFLIYRIYQKLKGVQLFKSIRFFEKLFLMSGIFYFVFLIYMTFTSTIDAFDYRTLLPFSFTMMVFLLSKVEGHLNNLNQSKMILVIKIYFTISLLLNLPKAYILNLVLG